MHEAVKSFTCLPGKGKEKIGLKCCCSGLATILGLIFFVLCVFMQTNLELDFQILCKTFLAFPWRGNLIFWTLEQNFNDKWNLLLHMISSSAKFSSPFSKSADTVSWTTCRVLKLCLCYQLAKIILLLFLDAHPTKITIQLVLFCFHLFRGFVSFLLSQLRKSFALLPWNSRRNISYLLYRLLWILERWYIRSPLVAGNVIDIQ